MSVVTWQALPPQSIRIKPAEIPVLQPARFLLIANVKAAQAIGMTLPSSLLLRADEVIE